jgi:hypothetical protein
MSRTTVKGIKNVKLNEYLDKINNAKTASELEDVLQSWIYKYGTIQGRYRDNHDALNAAGEKIVKGSKYNRLIPVMLPYHKIQLCGQIYKIGSWGNAAGYRYAMHYAEKWMEDLLTLEGIDAETIKTILSWAFNYPHRSLMAIEIAFSDEGDKPCQG